MNIKDFVTADVYEDIAEKVRDKKEFEYIKSVYGNGNKYRFRLNGMEIRDDRTKRIWHGNDYLVGINIDYSGKRCGFTGKGYGIDDMNKLSSWGNFKEWVDGFMSGVDGYEAEEYGQVSLF